MSESVTAFYARFSTYKQRDTSIDDQFAGCEAYWRRLPDWKPDSKFELFSDSALSGSSMVKRQGLTDLLQRIQAGGVKEVVLFSFDRFSRRMSEAAWLVEQLTFHRVPLHTVQDGLISDMHVALRGYESASFLKKLGADTKRGQAGAAARGAITGSILYGYRVVRTTEMPTGLREIDEAEAEIIILIFDLYVGGKSPKEICAFLNQEGIPGPRGGKWAPTTLLGRKATGDGLLRQRLYIGWHDYGRTEARHVPGEGRVIHDPRPRSEWVSIHHPNLRIVSDELFEAAQERLAENARRKEDGKGPVRRARRPASLLAGLTECSQCGESYAVADSTSLGCRGHRELGVCDNDRRVRVADVETAVLMGMQNNLLTPELLEPYAAEYQAELAKLQTEAGAQAAQKSARAAELQRQHDRLMSHLMDEDTDSHAGKAIREKLNSVAGEQALLEREEAREPCPVQTMSSDEVSKRIRSQFATFRGQLAGTELEAARAREIVRGMIDKVIITPVRLGRQDGRGAGPVRLSVHGRMTQLLDLADVEIGRVLLSQTGSNLRQRHATGAFVLHLDTTEETGVPLNASLDQLPIVLALEQARRPLDMADLVAVVATQTELNDPASKRRVTTRVRSCVFRMEGRRQLLRVQQGRQVAWTLPGLEQAASMQTSAAPRMAIPPRANVTILS